MTGLSSFWQPQKLLFLWATGSQTLYIWRKHILWFLYWYFFNPLEWKWGRLEARRECCVCRESFLSRWVFSHVLCVFIQSKYKQIGWNERTFFLGGEFQLRRAPGVIKRWNPVVMGLLKSFKGRSVCRCFQPPVFAFCTTSFFQHQSELRCRKLAIWRVPGVLLSEIQIFLRAEAKQIRCNLILWFYLMIKTESLTRASALCLVQFLYIHTV